MADLNKVVDSGAVIVSSFEKGVMVVLLMRTSRENPWEIPTGGVLKGESTLDAAIRRLEAECGLRVEGPLEKVYAGIQKDGHAFDVYSLHLQKLPAVSPQPGQSVEVKFFNLCQILDMRGVSRSIEDKIRFASFHPVLCFYGGKSVSRKLSSYVRFARYGYFPHEVRLMLDDEFRSL